MRATTLRTAIENKSKRLTKVSHKIVDTGSILLDTYNEREISALLKDSTLSKSGNSLNFGQFLAFTKSL